MAENKRSKDDQKIDEVIDKLLKSYRLDGKMLEMEIINSWEEIMGKAIALRTDRITFQNEVMYLKMNSSVIRDELLAGKQVIIERVNQKAGKKMINDIWFE
jgi:hypothetical protein